ncbi:hypothetical protein I7I53_04541 [Histoplasma capsulatum var. duboisii H88]|uniref:Uncharacterized protein n=1 Tax=Ajellomyces capsulatus (strain H88) TaxID=544711 RepID=A0A8A1LUV6_AJEC8|nr:hypothetical protein I7I53_04541 [Histoplasma capsulatum var. duboisii H88]
MNKNPTPPHLVQGKFDHLFQVATVENNITFPVAGRGSQKKVLETDHHWGTGRITTGGLGNSRLLCHNRTRASSSITELPHLKVDSVIAEYL